MGANVTLWTDGGKGTATSLHSVLGRDVVAHLLVTVAANVPTDSTVAYRPLNGAPSAVLLSHNSPFAALILDLTPDGTQITAIYSITNPDKLTRI
jgi:hypothetical protein